eukprot:bmy_14924T0
MNPSTHTIPPHQHKPRSVIHISNIKTNCILHSMIWLSLQLKIRINWSPTSTETNRAPFDLTEGESELVSGFNVEYAAGPFAIFFLAEYANIIIINIFTTILLLGAFHKR